MIPLIYRSWSEKDVRVSSLGQAVIWVSARGSPTLPLLSRYGYARAGVVDFVQGVTSPSLTFEFVTPPSTTFTNLILLPVSAPRIQCRFVEPNRWTIAANQFGYAPATLAPRSVSRYSLVVFVFTRTWTRQLFYQLAVCTTRTLLQYTNFQACPRWYWRKYLFLIMKLKKLVLLLLIMLNMMTIFTVK